MPMANLGRRWRAVVPPGVVGCLLLAVLVLALLVSGVLMRFQMAAVESFNRCYPWEYFVATRWSWYVGGDNNCFTLKIDAFCETHGVSSVWSPRWSEEIEEDQAVRCFRCQPDDNG